MSRIWARLSLARLLARLVRRAPRERYESAPRVARLSRFAWPFRRVGAERRFAPSSAPPGAESLEWRPRELAERLARRARRRNRAGRGRPCSPAASLLQRYGRGFYRAIGSRGGSVLVEERGRKYLQAIAARGGAATRDRYGREHYAAIGRKGAAARQARLGSGRAGGDGGATPRGATPAVRLEE